MKMVPIHIFSTISRYTIFLIKGWKYKVTFEINILKHTYLIFNVHFAIVQISFGQVQRTRANVHILVEFRQFPHIPISKIQSESCSFVRLFLLLFAHLRCIGLSNFKKKEENIYLSKCSHLSLLNPRPTWGAMFDR
jgi:hypothetical protein